MKKEKENKENMQKLIEILKKCNNKDKKGVMLTFTNLKASKSGMSRTFNIYCTTKKGDLLNITYLVAKITENTFTNNYKMRINGCGMDMLFETCYQLNCAINRLKGKKYNSDIAYHGYVNTTYNLL